MLDTEYLGSSIGMGGFNHTLYLHSCDLHKDRKGTIYLATYDPMSHLNITFGSGDFSAPNLEGSKSVEHCLSPEEAMWLRDELIKAYPLNT